MQRSYAYAEFTPMIFANPVRGTITPYPKDAPAGIFQVTQPFGSGTGIFAGEPKLGGVPFHRGIDLGNERCGAPVLAAQAGEVQFAGLLGNGEIVVVLDHGGGWGSSYGHLKTEMVVKGQRVAKGAQIGSVGDTGFANGCHLHFAIKSGLPAGFTKADFIPNPLGGRGDTTGKWENPWPLLEQNQPEDDMPPLATYIPGHSASVAKGFNVRTEPTTTGTSLRITSGPETWSVIGWVKGAAVSGSDQWLVRWNGKYEYVHKSGVTQVSPAGDCTAAVKAATDPLVAKLDLVQLDLNKALARISAGVAALTQ